MDHPIARLTVTLGLAVGIVTPCPLLAQERGGEGPQAAPASPGNAAYRVAPAAGAIVIDGRLDEPAWQAATVIPLNYEWFPGDNATPPVRTDVLVTYDASRFYVAFRAHDPRPAEIRAHLMDRDSIDTFIQDDHVGFMLDTFNDERRAFQFRVNPLGVQADALFSQVEGIEDFSWDIMWDSAGEITGEGYVVEAAVPLNQLRFPDTSDEQTWGVEFTRSYPRSVRHRISANPRDRNDNCLLCQVSEVSGFTDLEPGLNLELDPTLTALRTDRREGGTEGDLVAGDEEVEPGITARWGFTPSWTLNATINPDFSQVEADVAQLAVNERFALFFPEKRPFFLEGVDLFATPLQAVFTRTVVDPAWGLKLTGKEGRHTGGVFVTGDEVNSLVIPSNQGSAFAFQDAEVTAGVVRYRRDVGANSTLGLLYAGREGDDYHNQVGGLDGFFRLTPTDELRVQYLRSDTLYPDEIAAAFDQPREAFDDDAFILDYDHLARDWFWTVELEDLGPGFRGDSGFIPRVDIRTAHAGLTRLWWGSETDWYTRIDFGGFYERTEDHGGRLTDEVVELSGQLLGPRQSVMFVSLEDKTELFSGVLYESLRRAEVFLEAQPTGTLKGSFYLDHGETVDFANNRPADILVLNPVLELKPGRRVNLRLDHFRQVLDVAGGELSRADLSQLRAVYNFSVRSFVRGILQYSDIRRDPTLFLSAVDRETESLFTQLLYSYKLNPQTVVFVGYSDNRLGFERFDEDRLDRERIGLTQTDRTFFVKLGYAWVL